MIFVVHSSMMREGYTLCVRILDLLKESIMWGIRKPFVTRADIRMGRVIIQMVNILSHLYAH